MNEKIGGKKGKSGKVRKGKGKGKEDEWVDEEMGDAVIAGHDGSVLKLGDWVEKGEEGGMAVDVGGEVEDEVT